MELKEKQKLFLEMFEKSACNISVTCKKVGISRETYYAWLGKSDTFKRGVEASQEGLIDFAETKLMENIRTGNVTANIFFLKTKGKHRGYVEKTEVESDVNIQPNGFIVEKA